MSLRQMEEEAWSTADPAPGSVPVEAAVCVCGGGESRLVARGDNGLLRAA